MINYQSIEFDDFSGGITDNYISGARNKARVMDNLMLIPYQVEGQLKAKLQTRYGSEIFDSDDPILNATTLSRISTLIYFDEILGIQVNALKYQNTSGDWTSLDGPIDSNPLFSTSSDGDNVVSYSRWQNHIFFANDNYEYIAKVYRDSSDDLQIRTAGLPDLGSSPVVTAGATGSDSYLYRFCYKYSYYVGTVLYTDRGALTEVELTNSAAPSSSAVTITSIPTLTNTASDTLWDTSSIDIEIYRTITGGETEFYLVTTVDNGTTSASDTTSDTTLLTNEPLYTNGGVVENDLPPQSKVIHIVEDTNTAYYGNIKDGTELLEYQIRQSIPGDPDSVPETFFANLGDDLVGISSVQGIPVAVCEKSVYRLEGQFDYLGRGAIVARKISETATCVSSQSIVQTIDGIFWAGEDHFYFSDGYRVIPLNLDYLTSYAAFVSSDALKKRIQGKYDKKNRRIWWTTQNDSSESDCNSCIVLHLEFGLSSYSSFTTVSGQTSFRPSSIEFDGDTMYRGDSQGYLFWHKSTFTTDPVIDTSTSDVTLWNSETILHDYESCAYDYGDSRVRKVAPKINITAQNSSNLSLDIISMNDDSRIVESLKPIRYRDSLVWGEETVEWGDPTLTWNAQGLIEEERRFPNSSYRFNYKQIRLTNGTTAISNSDVNGSATIDSTAMTVALNDGTFSSAVPGYVIALDQDDYTFEYPIVSVNTAHDTIVVTDTYSTLVDNTAADWVVRGKPKGDILDLISYSMDIASLGRTHKFYRKSDSGEVGT